MNSRIKSLDGLRGILCILVVFHHYDAKYIPPYFFENFIIRQADLLVDFFFIISGFVISYNYKHIATIEEAKLFLKKRFFRLYPLLLYTTTLYFIFEIVSRNAFSSFINKEINNTTIIKSYLDTLFLNNSTPLLGSSWGINRPTWSISAEFYSYVFFSIALIWITPKFRNIIMGLPLIAAAIILFYVSRNGKVSNAEYGYLRCLYLFIGGF
ncbi:MAG: acyltransferase, partial [Chitinophagia bacterium]|nr:acyltransferase [Chitinophagia bacterium]